MNKADLKIIKSDASIIQMRSKTPFRFASRAKLIRSLMQDDYIDVSVEAPQPIELNLEDKVEADGRDYLLNLTPLTRKEGERRYRWNIRFEEAIYLLRRYSFFNRDSQGRGIDFEFNFVGDLEDFIDLIIMNANDYTGNWVKGTVEQGTDDKNIRFTKENCRSALQLICEIYDVEFYVTIDNGNYELNVVTEIGQDSGYTFEYGKGNGLYSLERKAISEKEVITRLYGFGSDLNLPIGYRNYSSRLRMPNADYVEDQLMINQFGYVEDVFETDIKPEFIGEVTSIAGVNDEIFVFSSTDMDFDLVAEDQNGNTIYIADGEKPIIAFLTGNCAGYEFDVQAYNHGTKTFDLRRYQDSRGQMFPSAGAFEIQTGDKFTILNIMMPQSYATAAEQRLLAQVQLEYARRNKQNIRYTLDVDPFFIKGKTIELGDKITLVDSALNINAEVRILRYEYDILADKYTFDLSDVLEYSLRRRLVTTLSGVRKEVRREIGDRTIVDERLRVRIRDLRDDVLDENDELRPEIIGDETITIEKLVEAARPTQSGIDGTVVHINNGGDENEVALTAGVYSNFAIRTGGVASWNMSALTASNLDPAKSYFIYAKTDKNSSAGTFLVSENEIQIDEDPDYYHFLTGVLYKPVAGKRNIDLIHGALPEKGESTVKYHSGPSAGIIMDVNIPGIVGMAPEQQAQRVQIYRNGARMFISSSVAINTFEIVTSGGDTILEPKVAFQTNDKIEVVYQ